MFRSKSNPFTRCKKHPKHKQSPGVCSICLVDKLSKLPATSSSFSVNSRGGRSNYNNNNNYSGQSSSSSISSLSSSDISSCASSLMSPATVAQTTRSAYLSRINFKPGPTSKSKNIYTDNRMKKLDDDDDVNCNSTSTRKQGTGNATSSRFSWSNLLLGSRRKSNVNHDSRRPKAQTISHSQQLMRQIASRV